MTPCVLNTTDGYRTCRVAFDDAKKAKSALDAASAGQLDGVTGAAAEPATDSDTSTSTSSPEGTKTGVIVGVVVALVLVVGLLAAFVAFKARRDRSLLDYDDDYSSMNMALEELSPDSMGEI